MVMRERQLQTYTKQIVLRNTVFFFSVCSITSDNWAYFLAVGYILYKGKHKTKLQMCAEPQREKK